MYSTLARWMMVLGLGIRYQCAAMFFVAAGIVATADADGISNDKVADAVAAVRQVDVNGQGHEQAVLAMRVLNAATPEQIPIILQGMDDANKLVVNWLRSAVVTIAGDGSKLPMDQIRKYFDDTTRAPLGRLLAFDLLTENDAALKDKLIPTLIDDPSLPLRYKAVANLMDNAKSAEGTEAIGMLGVAIEKARDVDQVIEIAKQLDQKGIAVDLQKQLGFINTWEIVGNFDNHDQAGFDVSYGPEKALDKIDTKATYTDAVEAATWKSHNSVDPTGIVDLNNVLGKAKGVAAYAYATYDSDADRTADIRVGCINASKVWVNGKLVMSNEIYHTGLSPEQYKGTAELKKGKNEILVKICQNEQTEPWAQDWMFQLRVCDETGKALKPAKKEVVPPGQ